MNAVPPPGRVRQPTVTLAHGGGGKAMKDLIADVFIAAFDNPALAPLEDQARFDLSALTALGEDPEVEAGLRKAFRTLVQRARDSRPAPKKTKTGRAARLQRRRKVRPHRGP